MSEVRIITFVLLLASVGCASDQQPPCPFSGEARFAPSAGCLAVVNGRALMVETYSGQVSPPGGKAKRGESAQCAAHRETWEETGLNLLPLELMRTFDTGFHLYQCEFYTDPGILDAGQSEVKRAFWLPLEDFAEVTWRYQGQGQQLLDALTMANATQTQ